MAEQSVALDVRNNNSRRINIERGRNNENIIRGTVIRKHIELFDPSLKRMFVECYPYTNSNLYLITQLGPNTVGSEFVETAVGTVEKLVTKAIQEIQTKIDQAKIMLESNLVVCGEGINPYEISCDVNSRLSNLFLRYFLISDKYLMHVDSLWLEGLISDQEKRKSFDDVRKHTNKTRAICMELCTQMLRKMQSKRDKEAAQTKPKTASNVQPNGTVKLNIQNEDRKIDLTSDLGNVEAVKTPQSAKPNVAQAKKAPSPAKKVVMAAAEAM